MPTPEYRFVTHWRVPGTLDDVADVLSDATDLPRWWPAVYLEAVETRPGDGDGIGQEIALHTRGWLPYTLRWHFRVTESDYPDRFALEAWGDFRGYGEWRLRQDGPDVEITYDWRVHAEKPLLRRLTWLLRPAFAANHRWAMRQGEASLRRELARRAAARRPPPNHRASMDDEATMNHPDPFDLQRFVDAQDPVIDQAIAELRAGRKRSHWMWFVFPQVDGLGSSAMAQRYAIRSLDEAHAYLAHPTLGPNLDRCVDAVLLHDSLDPSSLMGWPDDLKLRSSMTLFEAAGAAQAAEVLERGYGGQRDAATVAVLEGWRAGDG